MISLPIKDLKNKLDQIFSLTGYDHQDLNIKLPKNLDIKIEYIDNKITIKYTNCLPNVTWKKFIRLSAYVQGIELNNTGGKIKLKYFPDINFLYEDTASQQSYMELNFSEITEEIKKEYPDEERQKIASLCLQYASEWATICCSSGLTKEDFKNNKKLKKDCYNFVRESILKEKKHGSVVISFILIYVILPIILKWIIEKIFRKLVD